MSPALGSEPTPPPNRDLSDVFGGMKMRPRRRPAKPTTPEPSEASEGSEPKRTESTTDTGGEAANDSASPTTTKPAPRRAPAKKSTPRTKQDRPGGSKEQDLPRPATPTRGRPRTRASAQADQTLRADRVVYVPDDVRDALAMHCAKTHRTRTQVVLDAIAATHTRLEQLVETDLAPTVIKGELWDEVVYPTRARQPAKRQLFISPTRQQLTTIDRLVDESGARDRSHLVVVALREHLQTD